MTKKIMFSALLIFIASVTFTQGPNDLIINIEKLIKHYELEQNPDTAKKTDNDRLDILSLDPNKQIEIIIKKINDNPDNSFSELKKKISDKHLPAMSLSVYIWAIGHTKKQEAVDVIIEAVNKRSDVNIYILSEALLSIRNDKALKYLLGLLKKEENDDKQYSLLFSFAKIRYIEALPYTGKILKSDFNTIYWKLFFIFGMYGKTSVPFLTEQLNSPDNNIRYNSTFILGNILLSEKGISVIKDKYWKENDPAIRAVMVNVILSSSSNINETNKFVTDVLKKEKDKTVLDLANQFSTLKDTIKKNTEYYKKNKKNDNKKFLNEYSKIFDSYGKKGSYNDLMNYSTLKDENKLIELRERILLRQSDECLNDLKRVNQIIIYNRILKETS